MDSQTVALMAKSPMITCFELGMQYLAASGQSLPFLIIKDLNNKTEHYFKLPVGCRGIVKMMMLRDKNLLAFICEKGYFYIVDISNAGEDNAKLMVKLNIRIPNE